VVVDDLDILRSSVRPVEADAPLLVDTNAVRTCPSPLELLEPVPGRRPQVIERLGGVEDEQLSQSGTLDLSVELANSRLPVIPRRCQ
jgi:hypothetical protein